MVLLLEFPQAQRFASERRVLWRSADDILQRNSRIVSQAGKGPELANDQGPVSQNREQKIAIRQKIHNKAS
jgi:hypothetical protein